ncbi:helix-turn-helix domain-containing protein [Massilia sp. CCM 8733]|uniref:Helix-turn-helix domain-containing protein n=2 Tax=Massilia mucilaginosa TaxID=2609282 RepID=A0ABX0P4V5_9BURK|nr:helix-turn-helix domain-containing protein [Massilia mucilaginosa]
MSKLRVHFYWSDVMLKYRIILTESEREQLTELLSKGKHAARKLTRARILLLSHEGRTNAEIVDALGVGSATVDRVRKHCAEEGVEAALVDRPRPGAQLKLDGKRSINPRLAG